MANVVAGNVHWFAAGNATWLHPGQSHGWWWNLGNLGEAISISVRPFAAQFGTALVIVENLTVSDGPGVHQALFGVRNVGSRPISQYTVTGSFISP